MNGNLERLGGRRVAAWCVDWLIISLYAVALVPLGLLLVAHSVHLSPIAWNGVGFVLLVAPAWAWLATWEHGRRSATPGKRLLRLRVAAQEPVLGWGRSFARNGLKLALPWELGHTAAFTLSDADASTPAVAVGMSCGIAACVIAVVYLVSLFVGAGRTPYDRVIGADVTRA